MNLPWREMNADDLDDALVVERSDRGPRLPLGLPLGLPLAFALPLGEGLDGATSIMTMSESGSLPPSCRPSRATREQGPLIQGQGKPSPMTVKKNLTQGAAVACLSFSSWERAPPACWAAESCPRHRAFFSLTLVSPCPTPSPAKGCKANQPHPTHGGGVSSSCALSASISVSTALRFLADMLRNSNP